VLEIEKNKVQLDGSRWIRSMMSQQDNKAKANDKSWACTLRTSS